VGGQKTTSKKCGPLLFKEEVKKRCRLLKNKREFLKKEKMVDTERLKVALRRATYEEKKGRDCGTVMKSMYTEEGATAE
jgi:hypothetical protein